MLLCGGTSESISLFKINNIVKHGEKKEYMSMSKQYTGHNGNISCCGFMSNEYFVTGSVDTKIGLWQAEEQRALTMYTGHEVGITSLDVFRMDGNIFASGSSDLTFRIWDVRMKNAAIRKFSEGDQIVSVVKFMPENVNMLAVGNNNSEVRLWDLRALGPVATLSDPEDNFESAMSLEFSKSGRLLFI